MLHVRDALVQRQLKLEDFFPKGKARASGKENQGANSEKRAWLVSAIKFTFVLVHKLRIPEAEVTKLIYMFRLEDSQDVDLHVVQKWVQRDSAIDQYFDYYLAVDPQLRQK